MPLQILPKEGSIGQEFGQNLTRALEGGLGALAHGKVQQWQKAKELQDLSKFVSPEEAQLISNLPPELKKYAYQNLNMGGFQQLQQEQGGIPQQEGSGMNALQTMQPQQGALENLGRDMAQPTGLQQGGKNRIAELIKSPQQKYQEQQIGLAQEKNKLAKDKVLVAQDKDTREFLKPYYDRADAARKNIRDYQTIIDVTKSGNVRAGLPHQLLAHLGISDVGKNLETQLVDKLVGRMGQNAATAFGPGTRLTNFLEQTYQRSQPGLWNTPEGIIAISEMNIKADEALELQKAAANAVAAANQGKIPWDVYEQIDAKIGEKIRQLDSEATQIAVAHVEQQKNKSPIKSKAAKPQLFQDKPPAKSYKGRIIKDDSGKRFKSNGTDWIEVK